MEVLHKVSFLFEKFHYFLFQQIRHFHSSPPSVKVTTVMKGRLHSVFEPALILLLDWQLEAEGKYRPNQSRAAARRQVAMMKQGGYHQNQCSEHHGKGG